MFLNLLQIELYKIFRRPRTYIAFGAIAVIIILIQFALKVNGKDFVELFTDSQSDTFQIPYNAIMNGYFVCVAILHTILIHVPLLVALIAGDMISGEANLGTLRLIAGKPISRSEVIMAKFTASVVYVVLLLIWMAILSLALSVVLFGTNDLLVFKENSIHFIKQSDVLWRFVAAFAFASLALTAIAAMALMFSVFAENSIGPIVATVCIVIVFTIIEQLKVPVFKETIIPWSFTSHMLGWKGFFYVATNADGIAINRSVENPWAVVKSAGILLGYIIVFLSVAIYNFKKKDILS
ncbi:MAG: ABC transporter permease subunit [Bacteroidetes bacterium]|nr:ABC transporter permease subunit [Bacteroidota bacterium]